MFDTNFKLFKKKSLNVKNAFTFEFSIFRISCPVQWTSALLIKFRTNFGYWPAATFSTVVIVVVLYS